MEKSKIGKISGDDLKSYLSKRFLDLEFAEASVSTAINSNKPLRAFVSQRDLRNSENERRLRERNDRI